MNSSSPKNPDRTSQYVTRVRGIPMLTADEEYQLAKKWRDEQDRESVDKLVASHLKLVNKIAYGYRGYGLPISDLIAEGNVGMMQAMRHFDPERGFRLSTYAMWWIKASIQEYILKTWSLVKIGTTASQKKLFFSLRKTKSKLNLYDDSDLTPEKVKLIAEKLNVKEHEVLQMNRRLAGPDHSLNAPVQSTDGESVQWQDWLADDRATQETNAVHRDEIENRQKLLDEAMQSLTQREAEILRDRRLEDPPKTLEVLGGIHNISRERVRQIEVKAFDKLQKAIKRITYNTRDSI